MSIGGNDVPSIFGNLLQGFGMACQLYILEQQQTLIFVTMFKNNL